MLVGGVKNEQKDITFRGSIHVLLMGDPGVAKSQLLSFISRLFPNNKYVSGSGASSAGLTAAVGIDPLTKEMILHSGIIAQANNGTCCIDEFDKISPKNLNAIHEIMEQQQVSIAKVNIKIWRKYTTYSIFFCLLKYEFICSK